MTHLLLGRALPQQLPRHTHQLGTPTPRSYQGCSRHQDSGGSFHGRHHHYQLRDGDEFYHYSRRRFFYTRIGTGLRLGTA
ncbi:hypothetical protein E2562_018042 [Oryza meyeriana var. granulata]|uniref:Uncharacterized protein n=1 Tax=Oryza meyeriana var. granulata TaxID=110450 RepID=A0A6G1C6W0_9ORYZ|nr:hypothetical protein E2562_018042 [Oryza meyeriana var. granulata]